MRETRMQDTFPDLGFPLTCISSALRFLGLSFVGLEESLLVSTSIDSGLVVLFVWSCVISIVFEGVDEVEADSEVAVIITVVAEVVVDKVVD